MELQEITYEVLATGDKMPSGYYKKEDVDKAIAEKDFEIDRLKEFNAFLKQRVSNGDVDCSTLLDELKQKDKEIAELKKKLMPCLNGDCILTCEVVEKYGKENAELKQKLENVQASMYADVVDANMEVRRLKRALYKACANWAKCEIRINNMDAYEASEYLPSAEDKFRKKAERWSEIETKCLKKAEEYK